MGEGEGARQRASNGRIVITGASGFIGSHLVPALVGADFEIVCILEPGAENNFVGAKSISVDICTAGGISEALTGAKAVIHLAARNHVLRETAKIPLLEYRRVNVEGTRNVVHAARKHGVGLFVHLSSVKAMGEGNGNILDETSPCQSSNPYGISKLESEEVVRNESNGTGMSSIILRLPMVYGPGNKGNLSRMIRWAESGYPFPIFHPENLRSMIYVGNVVAGIMAILQSAPQENNTYILKDREDYSTRRVYSAICDALGKKPRYLPVPSPVVRLGGLLSEDFRKITGSFRVSSAKFVRDVNFTPPFSLEEGITRTVEWYKRSAR
jgi:nucleoside-diphosphate-sugar epimerase